MRSPEPKMSSPYLQASLQCPRFVKRLAISGNADVNVCSGVLEHHKKIGRVSGLVPDKYKRRMTCVLPISEGIAATLARDEAECMLCCAKEFQVH